MPTRWLSCVGIGLMLFLVACSAPHPSPTPGGSSASLAHYATDEFAFDYPAGWENRLDKWPTYQPHNPELDAQELVMVHGDSVSFTVLRQELAAGADLKDAYDHTYRAFEAQVSGFSLVSEGERTAGGLSGCVRVYKHFHGEPLVQEQDVWLAAGSRVYILACSTSPGRFEAARDTCDAITNSFRIL